jgi:NTE family protein
MMDIGCQRTFRRALVLSGGGARGAYEVGVLKALNEMGFQFDIVFGTSIGAINAIFFAQQAMDRLEEIWSGWRPKILSRPTFLQCCAAWLSHKWNVFDPEPIEALLRSELDLQKLHNSPTTAGFVITDLCTLETRVITTDEITTGPMLIDVLMAACALPFVFPPRQLDGGGLWIDGGIVRNTPVLSAMTKGASEIYTVLLHARHRNACPASPSQYLARCVDVAVTASALNGVELVKQCNLREGNGWPKVQLTILQPHESKEIGLFDFDPRVSRQLIRNGYEDTLTALRNEMHVFPVDERERKKAS